MTGEELRTRYFTAMRGADKATVLGLFAENAVAFCPMVMNAAERLHWTKCLPVF